MHGMCRSVVSDGQFALETPQRAFEAVEGDRPVVWMGEWCIGWLSICMLVMIVMFHMNNVNVELLIQNLFF